MSEKGVDEDFGKGSKLLQPLLRRSDLRQSLHGDDQQAALSAAPLQIGDVGTCSAVTDEHARVLRPDGSADRRAVASGTALSADRRPALYRGRTFDRLLLGFSG
ncbi:MAG: hypothetical protein R3E09_11285 [Novosphingobium sp.]